MVDRSDRRHPDAIRSRMMPQHHEGAAEMATDGRWVIPCGVCRRPWPCAAWHEQQAQHHIECAESKSNAIPYPKVSGTNAEALP